MRLPRLPVDPLPVDDVLASLIEALRQHGMAILRAPTGAGKTTRVPPAIARELLEQRKQVWMLEPRRLAARAAARRMAFEWGCAAGEQVGYWVRNDRRAGPATRVLVITEGIFMRCLLRDPYLENVGAVVLDEFHERSLDSDLALGAVRLLQQTVRPDLKLLVMSATLDVHQLCEFLPHAPQISSEGRLYPVAVHYRPRTAHQTLAEAVREAVEFAAHQTAGDLLVFLPGMAEIKAAERALSVFAAREQFDVRILHGELPVEQQDAALLRGARRKVVLSTNVAETSVTVEGITAVVDSGLMRQLVYDPRVGLDRRVLVPVSQSSAEQRMGRAGRLSAGICLRLWDANYQRARAAHAEPEIRRIDLAGAVLQLTAMGESDVERFPWLEAPRSESIAAARELLERLGALQQGKLTECGERMSHLGVTPRLARMLLEGERLGVLPEAGLAAALLSERDPFRRGENRHGGRHAGRGEPLPATRSDIVDRVEGLLEFEQARRVDFPFGTLSPGQARFVLQARDQLLRTMRRARDVGSRPSDSRSLADRLGRALLAGFPDRVVKRRQPDSPRGVMVGGRGIKLEATSGVSQWELFLAVDLEAGAGESRVWLASAIEREWLDPRQIASSTELEFDASSERLVARRRVRYSDLILEQEVVPIPKDERPASLLAEAAKTHWDRVMPPPDSDVGRLLVRVAFLREAMPELELPEIGPERLRAALLWLCEGCRGFEDLRRANWAAVVNAELTPLQRAALQREAPEKVPVPSGSQISILYQHGRPPVLPVRIQELFGWKETPRIAGGRVKLLLHLLGPNYRPQQITDDLASFWTNGYPTIRKELKRRYPRHAWPEDPRTATAERRPQRR